MLVTIGIAADNLVVAGLSGNGFSMVRHHKWVFILLLLFIIQNEMLILGNETAIWTQSMMNGQQQWIAIGILMSMGLKMLQESFSGNKEIRSGSFAANNFLLLGFSTSIYVFAFGCAVHWLKINDRESRISILILISMFLVGGLFLGRHHYDKLLKRIHTMSVLLVLTGAVILFIEKFKW